MKDRLPVDVHFVVRHTEKWRAWIDDADPSTADLGADDLHDRIVTNEDCWTVSTWLHLRRLVDNVYLRASPPAGGLCVVSGLDFGIRDLALDSFFIAVRSDGPDPALSQMCVVQNPMQASAGEGSFIPHWPQPGLVPRDVARGSRIEQMVFYGSENNLDPRFRTPGFAAALQQMGVRLVVHGRDGEGKVAWNVYREADLVLAARNLTVGDARTKPSSKLVNAWRAGVPALLGPEPAFQALRQSPLDYLEVRTVDDALRAVALLRLEPARYEAIVRHGQDRAQAYTTAHISRLWCDFLSGPAAARYQRWQRTGRARRAARWLVTVPAHKLARARADAIRDHGPRILDLPARGETRARP